MEWWLLHERLPSLLMQIEKIVPLPAFTTTDVIKQFVPEDRVDALRHAAELRPGQAEGLHPLHWWWFGRGTRARLEITYDSKHGLMLFPEQQQTGVKPEEVRHSLKQKEVDTYFNEVCRLHEEVGHAKATIMLAVRRFPSVRELKFVWPDFDQVLTMKLAQVPENAQKWVQRFKEATPKSDLSGAGIWPGCYDDFQKVRSLFALYGIDDGQDQNPPSMLAREKDYGPGGDLSEARSSLEIFERAPYPEER
jgi:hypothetical protein